MNLERYQEKLPESDPFALLSNDLSEYLQPYGFPKQGARAIEGCLATAYRSKIIKAVVLAFTEIVADGIIFPPVLEFNMVLSGPQNLFDEQQQGIIEEIGGVHDKLGFMMAGLSCDSTIIILNPDMYPLPNPRKPLQEIREDGSVYRRRIVADLLFT